jgi:hypothetical protein
MGRYLHVAFSLRIKETQSAPLEAWLTSSFQNGGIDDEEIYTGLFRSQLGHCVA